MRLVNKSWKELLIYARLNHSENSDPLKALLFFYEKRNSLPSLAELNTEIFKNSTRRNVSNKLSEIKLTVEDYFVWKQIKKSEKIKKYLLINFYINNGFQVQAERTTEKVFLELQERIPYDIESSLLRHKLFEKVYFHSGTQRSKYGLNLLNYSINSLQKYTELTSLKFDFEKRFLEKFNVGLNESNHNEIYYGEPQFQDMDIFFEEISVLIQNPNSSNINIVINRLSLWPIDKIEDIFLLAHQRALKCASYNYSSGDQTAVESILRLYQIALEKNIYLSNGYLAGNTFCNIVQIISALGQLENAKEIIDSYKDQILPSEKKTIHNPRTSRHSIIFLSIRHDS